jgi:hypothetical protein
MRTTGVVLIVLGLLGIMATGAHAQQAPATPTAAPSPAAAQPPPGVVARPDLALGLRDLPPGYQETTPISLTIGGTPVDDQAMLRSGAGAGPVYIWSAVYEAIPPAVTDERLERLARDIAVLISRSATPLELSDWDELDPAGLGDFARVYGFEFRSPDVDRRGDGALAAFNHGNVVAYLAVMSFDGRAVTDLRQYGRTISGRIQQSDATRPAGAAASATATPASATATPAPAR